MTKHYKYRELQIDTCEDKKKIRQQIRACKTISSRKRNYDYT